MNLLYSPVYIILRVSPAISVFSDPRRDPNEKSTESVLLTILAPKPANSLSVRSLALLAVAVAGRWETIAADPTVGGESRESITAGRAVCGRLLNLSRRLSFSFIGSVGELELEPAAKSSSFNDPSDPCDPSGVRICWVPIRRSKLHYYQINTRIINIHQTNASTIINDIGYII